MLRASITALSFALAGAACERAALPIAAEPRSNAAAAPPSSPCALGSLSARLACESGSRPEAAPSVADVYLALERAGMTLAHSRQVLAAPIGARYCELADLGGAGHVSVCEFEGAEAAERGRAFSSARFGALMPGRVITRHEGTLVTWMAVHEVPRRAVLTALPGEHVTP
ncbi:MAG: hypothetical protein RL385_2550 [Pseudomonadota bacterium]|jgi:hypothetical protein